MKLLQLKNLIKHGESEVLEFKKSTGLLVGAMQTVCAFLNSEVGGTVLIGVVDNKKILGQEISDDTKKAIAQELSKIEPTATPQAEYVRVGDNLYVIAISVKSGNKAPYIYEGRPYMRSQSTTRRMPQEKYEQMLHARRSTSIAWEDLTTNDCTITDLDKKLIQQVVNMAVSTGRLTAVAASAGIKEILKKFKLLSGDQPTNAAVVLFCKNEQKQFIQSMIKLARFKGVNKSEFIDNKAHHGNIFELLEIAQKFLHTYLPISGKIEENSLLRKDSPAIPTRVLREALINAFCHRDYSIRGGSVDVAIYDDRVEISNSGPLPPDIKLGDLTKVHGSFPRNPIIANVLYQCGMIERWGRGTLDMIEFCKESGIKPPKFEESTGSFTITFILREPISRINISLNR